MISVPHISVHPRVCGEQSPPFLSTCRDSGSSPRVRGTGYNPVFGFIWWRFIPACAGNRTYAIGNKPPMPVHPRVCGEQVALAAAQKALRRFIPACAGNSLGAPAGQCQITVHPRVCGEQVNEVTPPRLATGSSPRVRGTDTVESVNHGVVRFIPACAGNSFIRLRLVSWSPVHPRVCGEQDITDLRLTIYTGSSPRVRGTAHRLKTSRGLGRFIPACAGNRLSPCETTLYAPGSSPRVRGTGFSRFLRRFIDRFIPACAGNSCSPADLDNNGTVHPRVCGEQYINGEKTRYTIGSSPRVRGTGRIRCPSPRTCRFIPACAGNRP